MQTGERAALRLGYYCAREFEFAPYEPLRPEILELGRACIAKDHRSMQVLSMLWRGIAQYASNRNLRYLLGCSSFTSQDPALGHAAFNALKSYLAPAPLQTVPMPGFQLEAASAGTLHVQVPKLLSAYLALGAWICAAPALDRSFGTIDFLTCLDLQSGPMAQRRKRFGVTA
jgi:putative hemolysin